MSHILRVGVADQIAYFRAYNTDGSAKTDLTSSTTGLSLSVFRVGASSVSISSLSNKAADNTAHADGAIRNVGGNLYTIDIPDAATATQVPSIVVRGSYTGGVIEGLEHPIVAYDPSVNYGTNAQSLDIQSRLPTTLDSGNMRSSVQSMAADTLTASALAADAVAEIAAAVGGSGGSGARTVTITVTLDSNPVEGATVRLTKSAETYTGTTNASGVVTFNVDDGTWTVAITAAGASFAGASLVVDGNETQTYTLTATSITPSSTGLVTGYWVCYSHLGVVESGVSITMICKKVPAESGFALDSATRTATSGADGIAQFANLIPGATYQVARGSGQNFMIKVPDDAADTIELNSILGT